MGRAITGQPSQRKNGVNRMVLNLNASVPKEMMAAVDVAVQRECARFRLSVNRSEYVRRLVKLDLEKRGLWPWKPEYANQRAGAAA